MTLPDLFRAKLRNSLRVLVQPMPGLPTASIAIAFRAGSRYETRETNGIAHFLEHMFFRGGERYPDEEAVASAIVGAGADMNACTSEDLVSYHIMKLPVRELATGFDVLADMVLRARFAGESIETERGVVLQELAMCNDDPDEHAYRALRSLLYPAESPLQWGIVGPAENIRHFRRDDFLAFRRRHYAAAHAVVAVAGGVDPSAVIALADRAFESLPAHTSEAATMASFMPSTDGSRIAFTALDREQVHFYLATFAPRLGDAQEQVAEVLAQALGGHMGSRVFLTVRSKLGLAYSAWSMYDGTVDHGLVSSYASVDPANTVDAVAAVVATCRSMVEAPADRDECGRTKRFIAGQRMGRFESTSATAARLAEDELRTGAGDYATHIAACDAVTHEEVRELAGEIFAPKRFRLALAGPVDGATIREIRKLVPEFR